MKKNEGIPRRIDTELDKILKEIAEKNELSIRQASKELADFFKLKRFEIKNGRVVREIKF